MDIFFIRGRRISPWTTFLSFTCLISIYFLLVCIFMYFWYLHVKTHAFIFYVPYAFTFYVIFTCSTSNSFPMAASVFKMRQRKRFFWYVLLWKVMLDKYIEHLTKLQRSCQQIIFSFFVLFCHEAIKRFFSWSGGLLATGFGELDQCCYNVVITFLILKQRCKNRTNKGLIANSSKSHYFKSPYETKSIQIRSSCFKASSSEELLGIKVDSNLTFYDHITSLCSKS